MLITLRGQSPVKAFLIKMAGDSSSCFIYFFPRRLLCSKYSVRQGIYIYKYKQNRDLFFQNDSLLGRFQSLISLPLALMVDLCRSQMCRQ